MAQTGLFVSKASTTTANGTGYSAVVNLFSNLPAANVSSGKFYFVLGQEGSNPPGTYYSNGTNWVYGGTGSVFPSVANFAALPAANTVSTGTAYYVLASQGTKWLPGNLGGTYYPNGVYFSNGTIWIYQEMPYNATQSVVDIGTDNFLFVTSATLQAKAIGTGTPTNSAIVSTENFNTSFWKLQGQVNAKQNALGYVPLNVDGSIPMTGQLILSGDASNDLGAVTLRQVAGALQGLQQKPTARVATTTALPANTYNNGTAGVGAALTGNANGALPTQDGITLINTNKILVQDEVDTTKNGLYVVTQIGTGGTPYILTRDTSMDSSSEFTGAFIPVGNEGTAKKNSLWLLNYVSSFVTGTSAVTFTQLNGGTSLINGTGITISGNTISVDTAVTQIKAEKNATGGYVGLSGFAIQFKNAANTFTSLLSNTNTAVRNYLFPDKNITIAGLDDIQNDGSNYSIATGTDTYAITSTPATTAYVAGQRVNVLFTNANTGTSTLNRDTLGVKNLVKSDGSAFSAGDIPAGAILPFVYNGTAYQLVGGGTSVANSINNATAKTTPVDTDLFGILDSAASFVLKKLTWANIKATLSSTFIKFTTNSTLAGLGNIVGVFDNNGTLITTYSTFSTLITDSTIISQITNDANWSTASVYTGTAIVNGENNQVYFDSKYRYELRDATTPVRMSINSLLHIIGNSGGPTIAAGAGAGTAPTISGGGNGLIGTDISGRVTLTTGTIPTAAATIVTITFNRPYGSAPYVLLYPANAATALLSGVSMVYVTSTTTTFLIVAGTTALTAATQYSWNYQAAQ